MADVRNLLKNECQARRITHPYATYSTTGKLICLLCQTQLKSEALWSGHLSSSHHQVRLQRLENEKASKAAEDLPEADTSPKLQDYEPGTKTAPTSASISTGRKRKASESGDDDDERKRSKRSSEELIGQSTPAKSGTTTPSKNRMNHSVQELQLPSRPATPQQTALTTSTTATAFDEDEWAAFEADIATADKETAVDATISAPAISTADLVAQSIDETNAQRKERREAELEGDKEDAARKLEEEFEEMEGFEERVRKLKEKRETLRLQASKDAVTAARAGQSPQSDASEGEGLKHSDENEDDDEDSDYDDDWDGFRLK